MRFYHRLLAAIAASLGVTAMVLPGGQHVEPRSTGFAGTRSGARSIRPGSRSKHRPHTAGPQSKEAARRRRQIAKGMLAVSEPWPRTQIIRGRLVKPHRSGGGYTRDGYRMAS